MAIHGWSMDGTVTVASTDTLTEEAGQGGHPWMVHGWHSNSGIHGYLDRGGWARWPSMDGPLDGQIMSVVKMSIHRWSTDGQIM